MHKHSGMRLLIGMLVVLLWCGAGWAKEQDSGVSSPLIDAPQRFEQASDTDGPVAGVWSVLTGASPEPVVKPPPTSTGKKAPPKPLTLREYLNQQQASASGSDTLLQYVF